MKIVLLEEAQRRLEAEDSWWRSNRDDKELFILEFEGALSRLIANPRAAPHYRLARGKLVRRTIMRKTHCHVYYVYFQEQDLIEI